MKKLIFFIALIFIAATTIAQLNTNLILAAQPPASLSEWGVRREILTYIINTQPGLSFPVIIKAEIKTTDGTVIGTTDLAKAKVFTPGSATTILFAADVLPLENILFTGKYKTSIQRTGKLPADNYILCVQLVRPVDFTPASASVCKTFYLASIQLPILMKPYNEELLDGKIAQTAITFRWTPVVPPQTPPVTYRLQVFEVLAHQQPMQALRSNQPLLDQEIKGSTQYIWRPQLSFLPPAPVVSDSAHDKKKTFLRFTWTIQSLDALGLPVTQTDANGEARSEPIVFFVKPTARKNN
ncbi:MAG TPA: hypothetical protein VK489_01350 [Ferruginibacter sp.]|nr:hypothetical protein [Ferruginibacter sp.]